MIQNLILGGGGFIISNFIAESLKANIKLLKRITHFTIEFLLKKSLSFYEP